MSAPLSTHSVHVPPRQTVHVTAELSEEAASIVLTEAQWTERHAVTLTSVSTPREALFIGVGDTHALAPGETSFPVPSQKTFDVVVGNWSDVPLEVAFEIWGKS